MKTKSKGFTLIELLAVIVILAVIALIATPVITGIIESSKKSSLESETKMLVSTINNYCMAQKTLGKSCGTSINDYTGILEENNLDLGAAEIENDQVKSLIAKRECIKVKATFDSDTNNYTYDTTEDCSELPELPKIYYAFGDPTDESIRTTDYTTLGKNVFVKLEGEQKSVCIVRNGELICFKNNNLDEEKKHVQEVFEDNCETESTGVGCFDSNFVCSVGLNGGVDCLDFVTNENCGVYWDDSVEC